MCGSGAPGLRFAPSGLRALNDPIDLDANVPYVCCTNSGIAPVRDGREG
jgi:hypothetical protein